MTGFQSKRRMAQDKQHCCTQACDQGRNCPLTYRYPRTLREAFPYSDQVKMELELESERHFMREVMFWGDVVLTGLGMIATLLVVAFWWGYYL
jgi:hypothetical protein